MGNEFKIFIKCILLCFGLSIASLNGQILKDTASLNLIRKGVDSIYNMQFTYSDNVYSQLSLQFPNNPLVALFKGIQTYWKNYPLLPASAAAVTFKEAIHSCIELSEINITPSNEAEYLLANLCARSLLLEFYANNELHGDVFPLASTTYQLIKKSFDFTSSQSDFYFFTGIYNYYREMYPKVHPAYLPLVIFFRKGSRVTGLKELEIAARNSILLKAEAFSDLAYICIRYENNYQQAYNYSKLATNLCPDNPEYLEEYIKNLLLIKRYDEAESLIISSGSRIENPFYQSQLFIFKGIIQEKKYNNFKLAQQDYFSGLSDLTSFGANGNEFRAYAYFGLSRISGTNGVKDSKRLYRREALKLADLKTITFD
jgi:hypothetical protein